MTAQRIIRTYYGIAATTTLAQALIWGVNTLFLLSVGFDIFQVMLINAAYTVAQVIFEVPTGVVADTRRPPGLLPARGRHHPPLHAALRRLRRGGLRSVALRRRLGAARHRLHLLHGRGRRVDGRRPAVGGVRRPAGTDLRPLRHHLRHLHAHRHHRRRPAGPGGPLDPLRGAGGHPGARVPARPAGHARSRLQAPGAHAGQLRPRDTAYRQGGRHLRAEQPRGALHHVRLARAGRVLHVRLLLLAEVLPGPARQRPRLGHRGDRRPRRAHADLRQHAGRTDHERASRTAASSSWCAPGSPR